MARTKKSPAASAQAKKTVEIEDVVKEERITLSVTVSAEELRKIEHICESWGGLSVNEWLREIVEKSL